MAQAKVADPKAKAAVKKFKGLVESKNSSREKYTKEIDQTIVKMKGDGKSDADIAAAIGRSVHSTRARIHNVLKIMRDISEYDYAKGRMTISAEERQSRLASLKEQSKSQA